MRLADHAESEQAKEWIEVRVETRPLMMPPNNKDPLGDPALLALVTSQAAALTRVRTLVLAPFHGRWSLLKNRTGPF
jgi:hypothetical protein